MGKPIEHLTLTVNISLLNMLCYHLQQVMSCPPPISLHSSILVHCPISNPVSTGGTWKTQDGGSCLGKHLMSMIVAPPGKARIHWLNSLSVSGHYQTGLALLAPHSCRACFSIHPLNFSSIAAPPLFSLSSRYSCPLQLLPQGKQDHSLIPPK